MRLVNAGDTAPFINRSLLIVRVKPPFIEWANSIDDGPKASIDTYEPSVYLVDDVEGPDDLQRVEKAVWSAIFEDMLAGWDRDPENWPPHRRLSMFRDCFALELHTDVQDIGTEPIMEI